MDLIELLFIAAIILLPLIEGILRKARGANRPDGEAGTGRGPGRPGREDTGSGTDPWPSRERTAAGAERIPAPGGRDLGQGSAAEMLPDDLWELVTGERRARAPAPFEPEPYPVEIEGIEAGFEQVEWLEEVEDGRGSAGSPGDASPEPVSLEYIGPEAISLEEPGGAVAIRRRSVDETEIGAGAGARVSRRRAGAAWAKRLTRPESLREAIILTEILGPPRGSPGG